MRGLVLSLSHVSPILLVSLLMLSTHLSWAQSKLPLEEPQIQLVDTPAPFARVSDAQTRLHLAPRRWPLTFEQNQGQTDLRMSFFHHYPSDYRLPTNANAAPYPGIRTGELWGKEKHFIGEAPKWPKFAPSYGKVPHETTYRVEDLEHFAHNIPWAGSIILRICQLADAHPHVMRVLTVVKPEF
jgi:hypothetical protein